VARLEVGADVPVELSHGVMILAFTNDENWISELIAYLFGRIIGTCYNNKETA